MRKRIISIMLVICMVLMYVPITAFAESGGTTAEGLIYSISDTNEVTITAYSGSADTITIPNEIEGKPVTSIFHSVFSGRTVKSITFTTPSSVTFIGDSAFANCTSLASITIPDSVISIKGAAFSYCSSLTSVTIPNSVTSIGWGAFYSCTSLGRIFLPNKDSLSIGDDAIPDTTSQVKYSLDTANNKVTITEITGESKVDIPAIICGYPVVAVKSNYQNKVGTHTHVVTCVAPIKCTICNNDVNDNSASFYHNLNHFPAKAATYSAAGNIEYWQCTYCGKYFSDENGNTVINQQDTVIPKLIYYTPTESFTSPVSNGNAIEIKAQISDGIATVSEITTEAIDKMLDNASSNGETKVDTITIDLSGAKQEVKAITLSKKTLETLATAIASEDNGIDTVTIVLSKASIVLDSKTLETVAKEAKGNDIKLVINDKAQSKLNASQQKAIKDYHVATLFEAIFESNGKEIHDFNGGTATVMIDFTPEEGKNMDYYHMVHISDDGVMTRYKTRYTTGKLSFTTPHFSDYAVIYDESEKNQTAIERPVPVTGLDAKAAVLKGKNNSHKNCL